MRHPAAHGAPWLRRAVALTGAAACSACGTLAPATAMAGTRRHGPRAQGRCGPGAPGAKVTGPHMYEPEGQGGRTRPRAR